MIIVYNSTTFDVAVVVPGSDAGVIAQLTAVMASGFAIFTLADDPLILNAPLGQVTANGVTATLKNVVTLTLSANPINLSDNPTVTIQLMQPDGVTPLAQVATVTFTTTLGTITNPTITTDGSGAGLTSYKPNKGGTATIVGTVPQFTSGFASVSISMPASFDQQTWVEESDLKNSSVSNEKIEPAFRSRRLSIPAWWHLVKPNIRTSFDLSFDDRINSIAVDDQGNLYANGRAGGNATLKSANKYTGAVVNTYDYSAVGNNLADQQDMIAYDGQNIWLPAGTSILKVRASDLTLQATHTLTGKIESAMWDGKLVWFWDNKTGSRLCNVDGAGSVTTLAGTLLFPAGGAFGSLSMDRTNIYVLSDNQGAVSGPKTATSNADFNGLFGTPPAHGGVFYNDGGGTYDWPIAADGKSFWFGGDGGIIRVDVVSPFAQQLSAYSAAGSFSVVGQVYSIVYTGDTNAVWAVTSAAGYAGGPVVGQFLRRLVQSGTTIVIDQEIDLVAAGMTNPVPICFDGDHLYVGDFGISTLDIVKIFIGK